MERTAYPRLKRRPFAQELADVYTSTVEPWPFAAASMRAPGSKNEVNAGQVQRV